MPIIKGEKYTVHEMVSQRWYRDSHLREGDTLSYIIIGKYQYSRCSSKAEINTHSIALCDHKCLDMDSIAFILKMK